MIRNSTLAMILRRFFNLKYLVMRELKFRVYDSISKTMHNWEYIKHMSLTFFDLEHYTLEQFTGLKDKNGVEIYEGDIVEVKGTKRHSYYITDVLFKGQSFTLRVNKTYLNDDSCLKTGVYVIGNIHENKDLV